MARESLPLINGISTQSSLSELLFLYFMGQHPRAQHDRKVEREKGKVLHSSGSSHNIFPDRLFPEEEVEREWVYGNQRERFGKRFFYFGEGLY